MYRFLFPIIIIFSIIFAQTDGDVVKNVTAAQRTDGSKIVDIYYDLEDDNGTYTSYSVYVTADWPGMYHNFSLQHCTGDVWENVIPGSNKHITCTLGTLSETQYLSGEYIVNVHAEGHSASEIPDSFEMVEFNTDNISWLSTNLADYNYEIMKYEVTASQYVEFLNDKLSQAAFVSYNDHDGWIGVDGGETYDRIYTYDDGTYIKIVYSNPGGHYINSSGEVYNDSYLSNDQKGFGYILGYADEMPGRPVDDGSFNLWIKLNDITLQGYYGETQINYPKIQFTSNNICVGNENCNANSSFFISEGHGNHPITNISYDGADAFAEYYGLRVPVENELYIPFLGWSDYHGGTLNDQHVTSGFIDEYIWALLGSCENVFCGCSSNNWDCNSYPIGSGSEINGLYDLVGNAHEMFTNGSIYFHEMYPDSLQVYKIGEFGGSYYQGFNDGYGVVNDYNSDYDDFSPLRGFRAVKTLAD